MFQSAKIMISELASSFYFRAKFTEKPSSIEIFYILEQSNWPCFVILQDCPCEPPDPDKLTATDISGYELGEFPNCDRVLAALEVISNFGLRLPIASQTPESTRQTLNIMQIFTNPEIDLDNLHGIFIDSITRLTYNQLGSDESLLQGELNFYEQVNQFDRKKLINLCFNSLPGSGFAISSIAALNNENLKKLSWINYLIHCSDQVRIESKN